MRRMTRKGLLKAGVGGAAVGVTLAGPSIAEAGSGKVTGFQIHGIVTNPDPALGDVEVSITVHGPRDGLSGAGWDDDPASGVGGACYFTQAGSVDHKVVQLQGRVLLSNNDGFKDAPVTTTANQDTGEITWVFAGFVFTGTGTVVKIN